MDLPDWLRFRFAAPFRRSGLNAGAEDELRPTSSIERTIRNARE